MAYIVKTWHVDDIVKPEDANRWERGIAGADGSSTGTDDGSSLEIISNSPPVDEDGLPDYSDYYVDFIAPSDYDKTKPIIIDGITYSPGTSGVVKDIQNKYIPNGAWRTGAPVRLRIVNGQVYLMGGGASSGYWVGPAAPTESEILLWIDTTIGQMKYRTTPGSNTWTIVKGVYNA